MFCFFSGADRTNTRLSRARLGREVSAQGNGGHKAEASVSAVPMSACCPTPWPGSTTCQTLTGELARSGRGSATVPVGLRLKSTSTHQPTPPSGNQARFLGALCSLLMHSSFLFATNLHIIVKHVVVVVVVVDVPPF